MLVLGPSTCEAALRTKFLFRMTYDICIMSYAQCWEKNTCEMTYYKF